MFAHLLLAQDTDLMYYASKMVYMSITWLHVTCRLFICTLPVGETVAFEVGKMQFKINQEKMAECTATNLFQMHF